MYAIRSYYGAPYTENSLGICVIDATSGPNTPRKVGPFLTSADVVAITKGDIISQAEREVFRERVLEIVITSYSIHYTKLYDTSIIGTVI